MHQVLADGALGLPLRQEPSRSRNVFEKFAKQEGSMGKGILLWLIGIPIPIILLLALFWH